MSLTSSYTKNTFSVFQLSSSSFLTHKGCLRLLTKINIHFSSPWQVISPLQKQMFISIICKGSEESETGIPTAIWRVKKSSARRGIPSRDLCQSMIIPLLPSAVLARSRQRMYHTLTSHQDLSVFLQIPLSFCFDINDNHHE